eukprot:320690-Prorocentrum_lima.AAC.1
MFPLPVQGWVGQCCGADGVGQGDGGVCLHFLVPLQTQTIGSGTPREGTWGHPHPQCVTVSYTHLRAHETRRHL